MTDSKEVNDMGNKLLNEKEAAAVLGCTPGTLRVSRSTGKLFSTTPPRHVKLGTRCVRYWHSELMHWLRQFDHAA